MSEIGSIEKNMVVGTGNSKYKAVSEAEVLGKVKPLLEKHKLIVFPVNSTMQFEGKTWEETYRDELQYKKRFVTHLVVTYKIVCVDTGESIEICGVGSGADSQDKGAGQAFTYSFKNALCKTFMMFSGEDTDNTHSDDIGNSRKPSPKTATEAGAIKLTFGKNSGKTLKEVFKADRPYLDWLLKADKTDKNIKEAIKLMFDAVKGDNGLSPMGVENPMSMNSDF